MSFLIEPIGTVNEDEFRRVLSQVHIPHFTPRKGLKIQTKEDATSKVEESVRTFSPFVEKYGSDVEVGKYRMMTSNR